MSDSDPQLTVVCCIEYGRLEHQTLLMLRSLRRFGGSLASAPALAVIGRAGPPLRASTMNALEELGVRVVKSPPADNPHSWLNYANKVAAVRAAERIADTPTIAWMDSDVLFAAPPTGLLLSAEEDFAARCEPLPPAVYPGDDANVPYWRALCSLLGVQFEDVPWIDRGDGRPEQLMYFNSGVFVWRKGGGFAETYSEAFNALLASRLAQADGNFFTADQVILTPVVLKLGLRWRHFDRRDHLMVFPGLIDGPMAAPDMSTARVIHYSGSLSPPHRPRLLARLRSELPDLAAWLEREEVALQSPSHGPSDLLARVLRFWRGSRYRIYAKTVKPCAG